MNKVIDVQRILSLNQTYDVGEDTDGIKVKIGYSVCNKVSDITNY
mgnify:CR=1 FL=1